MQDVLGCTACLPVVTKGASKHSHHALYSLGSRPERPRYPCNALISCSQLPSSIICLAKALCPPAGIAMQNTFTGLSRSIPNSHVLCSAACVTCCIKPPANKHAGMRSHFLFMSLMTDKRWPMYSTCT